MCVIVVKIKNLESMQHKNVVKLGYIHLRIDYKGIERKRRRKGALAKPSPLQSQLKC